MTALHRMTDEELEALLLDPEIDDATLDDVLDEIDERADQAERFPIQTWH